MDFSVELEWYKHIAGRQEDTALYSVMGKAYCLCARLTLGTAACAATAATFVVNDSRASSLQ